mmetsp:Transcript_13199/g.22353  ORF Transcript_13199/g.22353 Transcript_13199/m.22353 type:complete len:119 (+) Transcript_13199:103-459(+)
MCNCKCTLITALEEKKSPAYYKHLRCVSLSRTQSNGSQVKQREKEVKSRPSSAFNKLLRNHTAVKSRRGKNKSRVDQDALSTNFCVITRQSSQAIAPDVAVPRQQKERRRPLHRRSPS